MNEILTVTGSNLFFLIGFMGSGKSLLSDGVKNTLDNVVTIEMDDEIERSAHMSINEIFETEGENGFRKQEQKVLHQIVQHHIDSTKVVLISTGGGAPCYFNNMDVMNDAGTTIFINPSVDRLCDRLEHKKMHRPLIKNMTFSEIQEFVNKSLLTRMPYYQRAKIHVNMIYDNKSHNIEFLKDIIINGGQTDLNHI